jgi:glucosamine-6-phosphate deaminase
MPPMRIEVLADEAAVAARAADLLCEAVRAKPDALLGLPTGNTPIRAYDELARRVAAGIVDFSRASIYAIDEFAGATRTTPGTNSAFYREHVRLGQRVLHCPNPSAQDPEEHIRAFADAIRRAGGIDVCVLGIGTNGHIAFNEPGAAVDSRSRVVELTPASRQAHAATFGSLDAVPMRGMTLGVAELLASRRIIVLATGVRKAAIVRRAIEDPPTADVPASWLQSHADVLWLLDAAAAAQLRRRTIAGLYVIIDPDACRGRAPIDLARAALEGSATVLQWRDKRRAVDAQLDDARAFVALCRAYGAISIINDYPELALASGADGVHLGQDDAAIEAVRPRVGEAMIIGVSTNNADEARRAEAAGANYVAIGAIFPTASKEVTRAASLDRIREVKSAVHVPVVAIGGINAANIAGVIDAGADAAAVISAVCAADDPRAAAAALAEMFTPHP